MGPILRWGCWATSGHHSSYKAVYWRQAKSRAPHAWEILLSLFKFRGSKCSLACRQHRRLHKRYILTSVRIEPVMIPLKASASPFKSLRLTTQEVALTFAGNAVLWSAEMLDSTVLTEWLEQSLLKAPDSALTVSRSSSLLFIQTLETTWIVSELLPITVNSFFMLIHMFNIRILRHPFRMSRVWETWKYLRIKRS